MNPTNHWKLGLFVIGGTAVAFALLIWVGASNFDRVTVPAFTYFDESVQGLDQGSPVKFRGVTIGGVTRIGIAQDQRLVRVQFDVYAEVMKELGFDNLEQILGEWGKGRFVPPNVRVSIASAGITGLKFLEVDVFDVNTVKPPPELDFNPLWNYVPSTPSTIKGLEESLRQTADVIPLMLGDIRKLTESVTEIVDDPELRSLVMTAKDFVEVANEKLATLSVDGLTADLGATLETIERAATTIERTAVEMGDDTSLTLEELRTSTSEFLATDGTLATTLAKLDSALTTFETELRAAALDDTTRAVREATASVTDVTTNTGPLSDDARATLASLRRTLDAVHELARLLERNPSALISGKSNP